MQEETDKSDPAPASAGAVEAPSPAGASRAEQYDYVILTDHCMGCGTCAQACPQRAIVGEHKRPHAIDQAKCVQCGACYTACRLGAILRM